MIDTLVFEIHVYVMCKVRNRTIRGFCCTNLGSELLHNNPRITHDPRICCANLGSTRNLLGYRNQTSAIRGNKHMIDRTRKAARSSASMKPQSIAHICVHDRFWVCCRGWPRFACAILGLLCKAQIQGLCSKIPRWSESILCA